MMENWYGKYESQCWYKNTFLVNKPSEIEVRKKENNSVYCAGCHFTCVAMILGVNPGMLATAYANAKIFKKDESGLVWDLNAPFNVNDKVVLSDDPSVSGEIAGKTIVLVGKAFAENIDSAIEIISSARKNSDHIICGYTDHSRLVAGVNEHGNYFVWDPDLVYTDYYKNLSGEYDMHWLFNEEIKPSLSYREPMEFWIYRVI